MSVMDVFGPDLFIVISIFVFNDVSARLSDGSVLHKLHTVPLMLSMGASNQTTIQTIFT